jgi:hypothetical protein
VIGFDVDGPLPDGITGAYTNLLVEPEGDPPQIPERFGPFLKLKGTASEYGEGIPNPAGPGFERNFREQLARRKEQGFTILGDVDNPDTFRLATVQRAYDIAFAEGFQIICKNPGLGCSSVEGDSDALEREDATPLLCHPGVIAMIVEKGAGTPDEMHKMRRAAQKLELPVFFVAFRKGHDDGYNWAVETAKAAANYNYMSVTYSPDGEYTSSVDVSASRDAASAVS